MALQALVPSSFLQSVPLSFTKVHPNFFYNNQLSCKTNLPSKVLCLAYKNNQENDRPLGNFRPTIWKDGSISSPVLGVETYDKLNEEMKDHVKEMLVASRNDPVEEVVLINLLCRLGVSYYFENEIEERLNHIFEMQPDLAAEKDCDLYTTAILFRVFRQHGFKVSSGVFSKFKDHDGKFKESLTSDARGMLSLYEATHLRVHGEDILEEALAFTTAHLKSMAPNLDQNLTKRINDALEQPFHMGVPRIEAHKFISFYEHDDSKNDTLLKFAKLDFNRVQLLHQQELAYITSIKLVTKFFIFRWDINCVSELPEYMKPLFRALLNLFDELNNELAEEGRSYSVSFTKDMMKGVVRAYFVEAQWFHEGYVPPFDERMSNAIVTGTCFLDPAAAYVGLGDIAGIDAYEWLRSQPKIMTASFTLSRLIADLVSNKAEQERGHVASVVESYMKEYGTSGEETAEEFKKMIADGWKDINEECMRPTIVPMRLLNVIVNIARLVEVFYKKMDGVTNPEYLKDHVTKLFIDPIPV
ncbi:hypothetical protein WN944_009258 [Citrus x changshan-huyou]|uniref:Uncharacterized protein n=1 Tax=Citrus x changshan-huyou TaxID=2935761 RepID=A0AAP0MSP1_9ROSI